MRGPEAPERERKALAKQHLLFPPEGDVKFIPADISSKNSSEQNLWQRKLERAKLRINRLPHCGKEGHPVLVSDGDKYWIEYFPHRCHSIFCRYCASRNFDETYARLLPVLEEMRKNGRLVFITLTHKNTLVKTPDDVLKAIEDAYASIQRFYQFRLFGPRNWVRIKRKFAHRCLIYYRSTKKKYGVKKARKKTRRQIRLFREFERQFSSYIGSGMKLGQILNAVRRFELTGKSIPARIYTNGTWISGRHRELHPHWHLIVADFRVPQLLLSVIWEEVSGSSVVDVRSVKNTAGAAAELAKYTAKSWDFPEDDRDFRVWVEAAMLDRRKFGVWGFELLALEKEEKPREERNHFFSIRVYLKEKPNLSEIPELKRKMAKNNKDKVLFDKLVFEDTYQGMVYEADLYLTIDGSLVVLDEDVINTFISYTYDIRPGPEPPLDDPELDEILAEI